LSTEPDRAWCGVEALRIQRFAGFEPDHLPGSLVDGRYKMGQLLGAGGMGHVFAGTRLSYGHPVAIKVLKQELLHADGEQLRFEPAS
jgi:serine/threonine protein kinase